MPLKYAVVIVIMLSVLSEFADGLQNRRRARNWDKDNGRRIDNGKETARDHRIGHRREQGRGKVRGEQAAMSTDHGHGFEQGHLAKRGRGHETYGGREATHHGQGYELIFSSAQEYHSNIGHRGHQQRYAKYPGLENGRGRENVRLPRAKRALSTKRPGENKSIVLTPPQGITYTWTRNFGNGKSFDEVAFKSKDKNLVVILSFDDTLEESNLTASATLYDFTGASGVMAIKPRTRPGPCFLVDTSLTYEKIFEELNTRNGSSVSTSTVISIDGTASPVARTEKQAILNKTPSLARQCRGREIVRTKRKEASPITYSGQTKEMKVLTMDAELSITVPVEPDLDFGQVRKWFQSQFKGHNRGKGQDVWKGK